MKIYVPFCAHIGHNSLKNLSERKHFIQKFYTKRILAQNISISITHLKTTFCHQDTENNWSEFYKI
jgi:hypothetical protein